MTLRPRAVDLSLAAVLVLAAALRLPYPGKYHLVRDEVGLLDYALALAHRGQWTWLGANQTTWSFLPRHSPLTVYLAAIPYLFSPDPRLGRLWVGALGVAAVAI
ncbi:MAG: hypothetical protein AAB427_15325, partial [Chloroflexota bacterium]